jgi:hypothetical protein
MSEYTAEMAHAAVARGAAFLDEKCPQWVSLIDLEVLDLQDGDHCILGQTATCLVGKPRADTPGYVRVTMRRGVDPNGPWVTEHGFQVPWVLMDYEEETAAYEMLGIAWKELIRERLAGPRA